MVLQIRCRSETGYCRFDMDTAGLLPGTAGQVHGAAGLVPGTPSWVHGSGLPDGLAWSVSVEGRRGAEGETLLDLRRTGRTRTCWLTPKTFLLAATRRLSRYLWWEQESRRTPGVLPRRVRGWCMFLQATYTQAAPPSGIAEGGCRHHALGTRPPPQTEGDTSHI